MEPNRTLVCPNCGANITNTENCEYCGSLLVRFIEKGIDLKNTNYLDNSHIFDTLLSKLKRSLQMREQSSFVKPVAVDIYKYPFIPICCVNQSEICTYSDGTPIPRSSNKGMLVIFPFDKDSEDKHMKFKELDCFPLFTERDSFVKTLGVKSLITDYYIDFGNDAEGAARLLSDILSKVYDISDREFECKVNEGEEDINKSRLFYATRRPTNNARWGILFCLFVNVAAFIVGLVILLDGDAIGLVPIFIALVGLFYVLNHWSVVKNTSR